MATEQVSLPPPVPDQAYMHVSALEAGIIYLPIEKVIADVEPQIVSCPSLAFLLRHSKTGYQVVFDLGTRRDLDAYPPAVHKPLRELGISPTVPQTVAESLAKGGVAPNEVDAVILSHLHWDQYVPLPTCIPALTHTASATTRRSHRRRSSSARAAVTSCAPATPRTLTAPFRRRLSRVSAHGSCPRRRWRRSGRTHTRSTCLATGVCTLSTRQVRGPSARRTAAERGTGHVAGHINVLARTSAHTWILLAGDSAHDPRIVAGEAAFACAVDAAGIERCIIHADKDVAEQNLGRIRALCCANVQVLIAHDAPWSAANKDAFLPGVIAPLA